MTDEEKRRKHREYMREYYWRDPEKSRATRRRTAARYSKEAVERVRQWRIKNKERWLAQLRDRHARRSPEIKRKKLEYGNAYNRRRRASDPNWRLRKNLSVGIANALQGRWKSKSTMNLLGCSIEDFWIHLESKFESGMTRENYGKVWHVDHIIPSSIFDLTKPEHQKRCFHFSNLQPLFAEENISKKNKVLSNQFNLL